MSIDQNAMLGSDEPPLRRLVQAQTSRLSRQKPANGEISVAETSRNASMADNKHIHTTNINSVPSRSLVASAKISPAPPTVAQQSISLPTPRASSFDDVVRTATTQVHRVLSDQVSPIRLAGHLAVVLIAAVVLVVSRMDMPDWNLTLPRAFPTDIADSTVLSAADAASQAGQVFGSQAETGIVSGSSLQKAIVPFTVIPETPQEGIRAYTVTSGDTVLGIANKFGLKPESIQWANASLELNPDLLRIGDRLEIPPVDGVLHTVQVGDTLSSIAAKYKVDISIITGYTQNELADATAALSVGTRLVVPGGVKPYVAPQVYAYDGTIPSSAAIGSGAFVWPTSGSVTQRYWSGHKAIDIGSWTGAPVKASDSGHVIVAQPGWNNGYGNMVVIDHGNGFVSLYGHLNSIWVRKGENISRGQQLGTVGNTGNSTGPHLHLEIRYLGVPRNPFSYLR